jgi:hypothetical protein
MISIHSRRTMVLMFGAALFACAELPELNADQCGNGVKEGTEQCDLHEDPELAIEADGTMRRLRCADPTDPVRFCRYVCSRTDTNLDAPQCPVGWGCSEDGVCHAASGTFEEIDDSPFDLDPFLDLDLADTNGDKRLDLVALTGAGIDVYFGRRNGSFASRFHFALPNLSPALAIADLDDDGAEDLVLPTAVGPIAARGERDRTLVQMLFTDIVLQDRETGEPIPVQGMRLWSAPSSLPCMVEPGAFSQALLAAVANPTNFVLLVASSPGPRGEGNGSPPPALALTAQDGYLDASYAPRTVITTDLDLTSPAPSSDAEVIFGLNGTREIRIYDQACAGEMFPRPAFIERTRLPLPEGWVHLALSRTFQPREDHPHESLLLADVNGDGLDDLLISAAQLGESNELVDFATAVAYRNLAGFDPPVIESRFNALANPGAVPSRDGPTGAPEVLLEAPWPIAAGDFDGTPGTEFVGAFGIYANRDDGLTLIHPAFAGPWKEAVLADLNGDGTRDLVAANAADSGTIEIVYAASNKDLAGKTSTVAPMELTSERVRHSGRPLGLRAGDFDGDFKEDVAYIESGALLGTSISVLYGAEPTLPVIIGSPGNVYWLWPEQGPNDLLTDLLLVTRQQTPDGKTLWSVGQFFGSQGRILLSPIPFEDEMDRDFDDLMPPTRVLLSEFIGEDRYPDLVAFNSSRAWVKQGSPGGTFTGTTSSFLASDLGGMSGGFDPGCSFMTPANIDLRTPLFEVVSITSGGCAARGVGAKEPSMGGGPLANDVSLVFVGLDENRRPRTTWYKIEDPKIDEVKALLVDQLDQDPRLEIIVSFGPPDTAFLNGVDPEASGVLIYWNVSVEIGGPFSFTSRAVVRLPIGHRANAIVSLNADADRTRELAVVALEIGHGARSTGDIYLIDLPADQPIVPENPVIQNTLPSLPVPRLLTTDVDRDGIDDIIFGNGVQVRIHRGQAHGGGVAP